MIKFRKFDYRASLTKLEMKYLVIIFLMVFLGIYFLGQTLELAFYDIMSKVYTQSVAAEKSKTDNRIIMVLINDESLQHIGRWPWPRSKYIELFDYLDNIAGAKIIAFDSVIHGNDLCNPNQDNFFFKNLSKFKNLIIGIDFKRSFQSSKIQSKENLLSLKKFRLKNVTDYRNNKDKLGKYTLNSIPMMELLQNLHSISSVLTDPYRGDGNTIRSISHIINYQDNYYPSLSLATLLAFYNDPNTAIKIDDSNIIIQFSSKKVIIPLEKKIESFNVSEKKSLSFLKNFLDEVKDILNISDNYNVYYRTWLKWYKHKKGKTFTHDYISVYKIFDDINRIKNGKKPLIPFDTFKNKIVIVGSSTFSTSASGLEDVKNSPIEQNHFGVDIQATAIDNLINSDFIYKQSAIVNLLILSIVFFVIFLIIYLSKDLIFSLFSSLFCSVVFLYVVVYILYPNNIAIDTVTPLLYLGITPMLILTYNYFIEKNKRGELQDVFSKLVSEEVLDEILKDPAKVKIGGDKAEITVLFADIRGFTSLSEKLSPESITDILNEYFAIMEPIIKKHHGTLNNYIGDAIMAIFGAPVEQNDNAIKAVKAALEMQAELILLQEKWKKKNIPFIEIGIGINTGNTFIGYVGSQKLMHYTAIGDSVNIASRLENLNKVFNTKIIISQYTYDKVRNQVNVKELKNEVIRGRSEPIMLYELIGLKK